MDSGASDSFLSDYNLLMHLATSVTLVPALVAALVGLNLCVKH